MSCSESNRHISTLVPESLLNDMSCFVLSDEHPLDTPFDIVVCTTKGEIIELLHRQVIATLVIEDCLVPREIKIHRNATNYKYYLVFTFENLYVVSTRPTLKLHKHLKHIDRYAVDDVYCSGIAQVRIWSNEDAIPSVLNENFDIINYGDTESANVDEPSFVSSLKSKLNECRHIVNVNEERYRKLLKFRQESLHAITLDMCPNGTDSSFKSCEKLHVAMTVKNLIPWLKLCNTKVVIGVTFSNETSVELTDIKLILQSNTHNPVSYETIMYLPILDPPYWEKMKLNRLRPNQKSVIVAVTEMEEFVHDNNIKYSSVIVYTAEDKIKFVPLEEVKLSCLDTLKESFDILSINNFDREAFVAVISTTHLVKLKATHIKTSVDDIPDMSDIFQTHLKMDKVCKNVFVHRTSPWHSLNGVMVILKETSNYEEYEFSVYLRTKSQLSSLLHLMYDGIPYRLLITTPEISIKKRHATQEAACSMEVDSALTDSKDQILNELKESLLTQTKMILEHFDKCITAMASNKSSEHLVGTEIDITAAGVNELNEFTKRLNEEIITTGTLLKL